MLDMSKAGRRYGCRPDAFDRRDKTMMVAHVTLPPKIDLSPWLGPVKDQAELGACTGFANAGMREFLYRKLYPFEKTHDLPAEQVVFSPLFIYYQERLEEGTVAEDAGAEIRDGVKAMNKYGVCLEAEEPYVPKLFANAPTPQDYASAVRYRGGAYHRLVTLQQMKSCLASEYVFVMGIQVFESFESDAVATTGIVPMPKPDEAMLGGHAVLCYGYDDEARQLMVRNSWGKDWGLAGNFRLPYDFVAPYVSDCWIQHLGPAW